MANPLTLIIYNDTELPVPMTFPDNRVTLGKSDSNLLAINSVHISRRHGVFERRAEGWFYKDVGSRNMTRLHRGEAVTWISPKRQLSEIALEDGDDLLIGDTLTIRVLLDADCEGSSLANFILAQSNPRDALLALGSPSGVEGGLKLLFETVRHVSQCQTELEVLEVIARAAFEALPRLSHVFLFRRGEGLLGEVDPWALQWSRSRLRREETKVPLYSRTLLEEAWTSGRAQLFSTRVGKADTSDSVYRARISSSVCAPLTGIEGSIGVLQADCRDPDTHLGESDLHLLTLLAEQGAVMIDRLQVTANIESMFEGFVQASIKAIESRDPSTAGHSTRVSQYAVHLAQVVNDIRDGHFADTYFSEGDVRTLRYAALLHDFGKIGVPSKYLLKATKLPSQTLNAVRDRFRIARMEVRARYAEERFERLMSTPNLSPSALGALKDKEEGELAFLEREEEWLFSHMYSGRIPEADLPRLKALTSLWHTAQVRLLEPDELKAMLSCRGTLTHAERKEVEKHAWWTRCYLEQIPWSRELKRVPVIAGNHHEKLNGRGYPEGRPAVELSQEVRILTVSDIFDALTARDRPYRRALGPDKALDILQAEANDGSIDVNILEVFREVWADAPVDQ